MGNFNNQSPVGTSTFSLPDGKQNTTYLINTSDLLLGFSDADSDPLTVISIFSDNGELVANGSDKWNFVPSNNYSGVVNLDYLITDNFGGEINVTKSFTVINTTPVVVKTNSPPTGEVLVKGIFKQGEILTVNNTLSDKDNLGTLSYQWLRNGEPISNGNQSSYALTETDVGKLIKVKVSYVDGGNTTETVTSSETSLIFPKDEIKIPTYFLSASQTTANEGDVVTLKLVTTNVVEGTKVPFSFTGNISNEDVIGGIPSSFYVGSDSIGTLALGFKSDNLTEGTENLTLTLTDDTKQSVLLSILDTSLTPVVIPVIKNNAPTGNFISNFATTKNTSYTISTSDLLKGFTDIDNDILQVSNLNTISGTLTNNFNGTWSYSPTRDYVGTVNLNYSVIDGKGGKIDAVAPITIKDIPLVSAISSASSVDEGKNISFTISVSSVLPNAINIPYSLSGTANYLDYPVAVSNSNGGIITIPAGNTVSSITFNITADSKTEGTETLVMTLGAVNGLNVNTSPIAVNINDTSLTPVIGSTIINSALPTYNLTTSKIHVNEGDSVVFDLVTTNLSQGSVVNIDFWGEISSDDVDNGLSRSKLIIDANGKSSMTIKFLEDNKTEDSEYLTAIIVEDPKRGEAIISVKDTSINRNNPPVGSVVIKGSPFVGQTLTVTNSLKDSDGLGTISYKWLSNGQEIIGATQPNYTLKNADVGKSISVIASYTDNLRNFEKVSSNTINQINSALPTYNLTVTKSQVNEGDSVILNLVTTNLSQGSVVNIDFGGEISNDDVNNGFSSSSFIIDANGKSSMTVDFLEDNKTEDSEYLTAIIVEDPKQTVNILVNDTSTNKNNPPTGFVTIKGNLKVGSILSATNSIQDTDGIGDLNYEWQTDKGLLSSDETLTLTKNELGKKIWLTISYVDDLGNFEEVKSNPTVPIENVLLKPSKGNDLLIGSDNNDKISALAGNDTLVGGLGKDTLIGGLGADIFKFNDIKETGIDSKSRDTISDFNRKAGDKIDLSSIDANLNLAGNQEFTFIGNKNFSVNATGQLRFDSTAKILYGSVNADKSPEFSILLSGVKILVIDDFIL
jgi:translation initiation factor IF-1